MTQLLDDGGLPVIPVLPGVTGVAGVGELASSNGLRRAARASARSALYRCRGGFCKGKCYTPCFDPMRGRAQTRRQQRQMGPMVLDIPSSGGMTAASAFIDSQSPSAQLGRGGCPRTRLLSRDTSEAGPIASTLSVQSRLVKLSSEMSNEAFNAQPVHGTNGH